MSLLFLIMQIVGYSLGGVLILIAVIYFIVADVKGDLAILTGQRARQQIRQISEDKAESERLRAAEEKGQKVKRGRKAKSRAEKTGYRHIPAVPDVSESLFSERLDDNLPAASSGGETVVLNQDMPPVSDGAGETTVLSPSPIEQAEMPASRAQETVRTATIQQPAQQAQPADMSGVRVPIEIVMNIKMIHTSEIIN